MRILFIFGLFFSLQIFKKYEAMSGQEQQRREHLPESQAEVTNSQAKSDQCCEADFQNTIPGEVLFEVN